MGSSKGVDIAFLDRFKDRIIGLMPRTFVLSLRSMCLRVEDFAHYNRPFSG